MGRGTPRIETVTGRGREDGGRMSQVKDARARGSEKKKKKKLYFRGRSTFNFTQESY